MTAQLAVESLEWDILLQDCCAERSSIYIEERIPLRSLHVFLIALSMLHGIFKNTVSGDWYICPVDFGRKSTCATQDRCNLCALVLPSHGCVS